MDTSAAVEQRLSEAFHLMYDRFPEPATLVHKSKRVVAVNPACKEIGREVGMICAKHGPAELHQGCLAARTVRDCKTQWKTAGVPGADREYVIFWLPVEGYPEYYIHFGVGGAIDYTSESPA